MEQTSGELSVTRLVRFDGTGSLKAYCDLSIANAFVIKGLRVVEGRNGLFVSMPRQQGKDRKWYDNIVLLNKQIKQNVDRVVLEAYQEETSNGSPKSL